MSTFSLFALEANATSKHVASDQTGVLPIDPADYLKITLRADGRLELLDQNGRVTRLEVTDFIRVEGQYFLTETGLAALCLLPNDIAAPSEEPALGLLIFSGFGISASTGYLISRPPDYPDNTPPSFASPNTVQIPENQFHAYTALAVDAQGDTISFEIIGGPDAALFELQSGSGTIRFLNAPDFDAPHDQNGDNVYEFLITAFDGQLHASHWVTVEVINLNDTAPLFTSAAQFSVLETETGVLHTVEATDGDGDEVSYTITGGNEAGLFAIDADTGEISLAPGASLDLDVDTPITEYTLTVTANDGVNTTTQDLTLTVTPVNEFAPVFTTDADVSVPENQTGVLHTVTATDGDGDEVSYAITAGNEGDLFEIDADTGEISLAPGSSLDLDVDTPITEYQLTVTASDGEGEDANATPQDLTLTVTPVNEFAPVFTTDAEISVAENQTGVLHTVQATDRDNDPLSYELSGPDAALFVIDAGTGEISLAPGQSLDFEDPSDADQNNTYQIIVSVSDGDNETSQDITLTVTPVNEFAPQFESSPTASVAENQTEAHTVLASDADGDDITYSITGGDDADLFEVDAQTGAISLAPGASLDFEDPSDADSNNTYQLTVTASDGDNAPTQTLTLTVTNVNDNAPVFESGSTASVAEDIDETLVIYTALATDADGEDVTYSLTAGNEDGLFEIDAVSGEISLAQGQSLDFETTQSHQLTVTATAGGEQVTQTLDITVDNVNDNTPVFSAPPPEGLLVAEDIDDLSILHTVQATDADGDEVSYTITAGNEDGLFEIDATSGEISLAAGQSLDYETATSHELEITATAGGEQVTQTLTLTVTNVNDNAPVFESGSTASVAEDIDETIVIYTALATDADGEDVTYSLTAGNEDGLFEIDPVSGEISLAPGASLDLDVDTPITEYQLTVTASDGDGEDANVTSQDLILTVTPVNEFAPDITSEAEISVAENQTGVLHTVEATDGDNDPITFALSGPDAALFEIDATSGEISLAQGQSLDFEDPSDADQNNTYQITVTASDGEGEDANATPQDLTLTVTNDMTESAQLIELSSLTHTDGFRIVGAADSDTAGSAVSSAGDVNGDGIDDILIGVPGHDVDADNRYVGQTYLIYGGQSFSEDDDELNLGTLTPEQGVLLRQGTANYDLLGYSVASAVDINGDGILDVLIGSPYDAAIYVLYGGDTLSTLDPIGPLSVEEGFILQGIATENNERGDYAGGAVATAGDFNGDGFDDFVIGAPEADVDTVNSAGRAYLIYGGRDPSDGTTLDLTTLSAEQGLIINGVDDTDKTGEAVASAGDINGDGLDDLIISAPRADRGDQTNAGLIYILYGTRSPIADPIDLGQDLSAAGLGFTVRGVSGFDTAGLSVAAAGDFNGDGYADLIIGVPYHDVGNDFNAGAAYVIFGQTVHTDIDLAGLEAGQGFIIEGADPNDNLGYAVASAGDVNGDGYSDLIIGAYDAEYDAPSEGQAYIIYGRADTADTQTLNVGTMTEADGFSLVGEAQGDRAGYAVASAGDINGDGFDDLMIGAPDVSPSDDLEDVGTTYIYYGGATGTESFDVVSLTGTSDPDAFTGSAGNDTFENIDTEDAVRGGAGDDTVSVTSLDFRALDGGHGHDTLSLAGSSLTLDLTGSFAIPSLSRFEAIDLTGAGDNTLRLDALAVFDLIGNEVTTSDGAYQLTVHGDAGDHLILEDAGWSEEESADGYTIYSNGFAQLRVQDEITLSLSVELDSLSPDAGLRIVGPSANSRFSADLSNAGDVNLDGYDDFIIGAYLHNLNAGSAYLLYGAEALSEIDVTALSTTAQGIEIVDADADYTGRVVSVAGDVNGDGFDDFLVNTGGNFNDDTRSAYVLFGGTDLSGLALDTLTHAQGIQIRGDTANNTGQTVSTLGDINGDGYDDFTVSNLSIGNNTFVIYGSADPQDIDMNNWNQSDGFQIIPDGFYLEIPLSATAAGDVNGDGFADILLSGESAFSSAGPVYLIYGAARAEDEVHPDIDLSILSPSEGIVLTGTDGYQLLREALSGLGDVNGDGFDDFAIGLEDSNLYGLNSGTIYVLYGGINLASLDLANGLSADQGFILHGGQSDDRAGHSVSAAGDVNGDGFADLIIGAPLVDTDGTNTGAAYIFYGGQDLSAENVINLGQLSLSQGYEILGAAQRDETGQTVSSAGDVNGDGFDDVLIGAPFADEDSDTNIGASYILYGGATGTESFEAVSLTGTSAADFFTGSAGNDSFQNINTDDVVRGGAGDDTVYVNTFNFRDLDGGHGQDTLVFDLSGSVLNLAGSFSPTKLTDFEIIDLNGRGNTLRIDELALLDLVGTAATTEDGFVELIVDGTNSDRLLLVSASEDWVVGQPEDGYAIYTNGQARIRVDVDIRVEGARTINANSNLDASRGVAPLFATEMLDITHAYESWEGWEHGLTDELLSQFETQSLLPDEPIRVAEMPPPAVISQTQQVDFLSFDPFTLETVGRHIDTPADGFIA